jgi:succinate dehydrogenase/fumarate reductase flavoprotein subunit
VEVTEVIECDVLVVGGGIAGWFASAKAREQGLNVLLADKGYVSKSGETIYAGDTAVFDPEWGHDLGRWLEQVNVIGEYMNNRHWNELVFRDSRERLTDLRSYGVRFQERNGEVVRLPHPHTNIELPDMHKFPPTVSEVVHWLPGFPEIVRRHLINIGVKLRDRFMVAELLVQEGRVVGAIGFSIEGNEVEAIKAKAVVMCAGGGGFRPVGYPTHELTADGHAMAYRVGAVITSKEFASPHTTDPDQPAWPPLYLFFSAGHSAAAPGMYQAPKLYNAEGDLVSLRGVAWHGWIDAEYEAHEGRAPLIADHGRRGVLKVSGPGGHGSMFGHATGGIVPVNDECATSVPGLYAAGDSCGTCFIGASYSGFGFATAHAAATGARAGLGAAAEAKSVGGGAARSAGGAGGLDERMVAAATARLLEPLERKGGFTPGWTTQVLQNTLAPYFVSYIKHGDRLRAALTTVEFLRDHIAPKLYARDDHELRLAHETRNMILNAEMKLRSSLARTESRGTHYREDFPGRNDADWLVWVRLKEEDGRMVTFKEPIPAEWQPDKAKSYEERYPMRLPNEVPGGGAAAGPGAAGDEAGAAAGPAGEGR